MAELSADEYVKNLGILSAKVWQSARAAQKIAQLDSSKYYNKKHGIKKDIRTGDLVFKTEIPRNKSDTTTHLLPRCSGPFKVVQISTKGAVLKNLVTGKTDPISLRHIRKVHVRDGHDATGAETGIEGSEYSEGDFVIVKMYPRCDQEPKWHVVKLMHITLAGDAWVSQWCNVVGSKASCRCESRFALSWYPDGVEGGDEVFGMSAPPAHSPSWHHIRCIDS